MARPLATTTKDQTLMVSALENVYIDLSEKCDRRTTALLKAVDALEDIRDILIKSKLKGDNPQRHLFTICEKALEQIEMHIADRG